MASPISASAIKGISYKPSTWTGYDAGSASGQQFAIYYPPSPASAYPVNRSHPDAYSALVVPNCSGYATSPTTYSSSTAANIDYNTTSGFAFAPLAWKCLMSGIAVIVGQVTEASGSNGGGGSLPPGEGRFHARGGINRYYEGGARPNCYKDITALFQFIKKRAATYGLHKASIGMGGSSQGGFLSSWLAWAPDRAWELMHGDFEESTVPSCLVAAQLLPFWWDRWENQVGDSLDIPIFPQAETGAGATTEAIDLFTAPARYKREISVLSHAVPGVICNAPTLYIAGEPGSEPATLDFSMPIVEDQELAETSHPAYFALFAKKYFKNVRVHLAFNSNTAIGVNAALDGTAITTDMFDEVHAGTTTGNGTAAGYRVENPNAGPDIKWILEHINDTRWDATIPDGGIHRSGQVETLGRFIMPPGDARRVVELSAFGSTSLVYGKGPADSDVIGVVAPGAPFRVEIGSAPLWARGDAGVVRYGCRELRAY